MPDGAERFAPPLLREVGPLYGPEHETSSRRMERKANTFFNSSAIKIGLQSYQKHAVKRAYSSITNRGISVLKDSLLVMDLVKILSKRLCFLANMATRSGFLSLMYPLKPSMMSSLEIK